MAARDLWPGYTAPLVQTLRKSDLCLRLSGAAKTAFASVPGQTWGYEAVALPTYCLSPNGAQLGTQLICPGCFCFQPLLCRLPAYSHSSAQARDVAPTSPGRNSCPALPQTDRSTEVKPHRAVLENGKFR